MAPSRKMIFSAQANEDLRHWSKNKPEYVEKIQQLLMAILSNPETGIGKPEPLRFKYSGFWSRRISREDRIIYRWDDESIEVISLRGHY